MKNHDGPEEGFWESHFGLIVVLSILLHIGAMVTGVYILPMFMTPTPPYVDIMAVELVGDLTPPAPAEPETPAPAKKPVKKDSSRPAPASPNV